MQAIVVDPQAPVRLGFQTIEPPTPQANEAVIRVKAISLNRREVVYRVQGAAGTRLGWDFAGVVEQAAADGSGPTPGTRVVGVDMSHPSAWAELAAVRRTPWPNFRPPFPLRKRQRCRSRDSPRSMPLGMAAASSPDLS